MSDQRKPVKVITLGKWSVGIFSDTREGFVRYNVNLRRNMSKEEMDRSECKPESLLLFEEETLTVAELLRIAYQWIIIKKLGFDASCEGAIDPTILSRACGG